MAICLCISDGVIEGVVVIISLLRMHWIVLLPALLYVHFLKLKA